MDQNPLATDLTASASKVALEKVIELSNLQAYEIWRTMQLIATNGSLQGLPGPVVQLAMDLNHFLNAWKVIAEKAIACERNTCKRKRWAFWLR
jgi:hypothetical protein